MEFIPNVRTLGERWGWGSNLQYIFIVYYMQIVRGPVQETCGIDIIVRLLMECPPNIKSSDDL